MALLADPPAAEPPSARPRRSCGTAPCRRAGRSSARPARARTWCRRSRPRARGCRACRACSATASIAFCGSQPPACSCARHNSGITAEACRPGGYFAISPRGPVLVVRREGERWGWISAAARRRFDISLTPSRTSGRVRPRYSVTAVLSRYSAGRIRSARLPAASVAGPLFVADRGSPNRLHHGQIALFSVNWREGDPRSAERRGGARSSRVRVTVAISSLAVCMPRHRRRQRHARPSQAPGRSRRRARRRHELRPDVHRSTSPNTMSSEPRMADTSASMWPRHMKSMAWRWAKPGARILQR